MNGRISIDHRGERHSAGLHWTHKTLSDEILLLTPLGQTAARVYRDDSNATLDDGHKHYQDVDAESLMQQVLGWHLPLVGLHQWVLGLPAADTPAQIERDSYGRIAVLRQDGWEVRYLRYADTRPGDITRCAQASDETTDTTTSHLTNPAEDAGQVIGYSHSTRPSKDAGQVAGYGAEMSPPRLLPQSAGCASNVSEADSMPTRMQLNHEDLQIQLLIDEWEWNPQ